MIYDAVTSLLTQLRAAALQSSDKCRIVKIADAALTVKKKSGSWDYRINGISYDLRQIEQALTMVAAAPVLGQCISDEELIKELAGLPSPDRTALAAMPAECTSNGMGWLCKPGGPWDSESVVGEIPPQLPQETSEREVQSIEDTSSTKYGRFLKQLRENKRRLGR